MDELISKKKLLASQRPRYFSAVRYWSKALLLFSYLFLVSPSIWAQQKLSIDKKNSSIEEILRYVRANSNYRFVYDSQMIKSLKKIDLSVKNADIKQIMDACLAGSNLNYVLDGNTIVIRKNNNSTATIITIQSAKSISGTVLGSENRKALPGSTVKLYGTNISPISTSTDQQGKFSISYPQNTENAVLQVSLVGKKQVDIPLEGQTNINISMDDLVQELDDIVVTGIFNKSKETFTGAERTISSAELKQFKGRNLFVTLGNIDPSFYIVPNNAKGSDPNLIPDLQLRGTSSVPNINQLTDATAANLNAPLIVINNFESTLRFMMDLDVNEIEDITILKDGQATALYGSRGANGVIVIRTKAPVAGKLRLSYSAGLNTNLPDLSSYNLLNAAEKLELERLAGLFTNDKKSIQDNLLIQEYYHTVNDLVQSGLNTNWLAKPLRMGIDQTHNIRMEGGDEVFRYSLGGMYNDVQGVMKGSGRKVFNGSLNLSYEYDKLTFRNNTIIGGTRTFESPYGTFDQYARLNPYWSPYDDKGNITRWFSPYEKNFWGKHSLLGNRPIANPMYDATLNNYSTGNVVNITNNFQAEWKPILGLVLRGALGIVSETRTSDDFKPANHSMFNEVEAADFALKGSYSYGSGRSFSYTGSFTSSYFREFDGQHAVSAGFNVDLAQQNGYNYMFAAQGFPSDQSDFLPLALRYERDGRPGGSESTTRRIGLVANANYSFKYKYILDMAYRLDGASQFGSNKRFAPFWSAGLAWNLHREDFIKELLPHVSMFKLRGSYGLTGSTQFSAYQSQSIYKYYLDQQYNQWMGAYQEGLANPNLAWQKTGQYNLGIDLVLFRDRWSVTGDIYKKQTSNLLSSLDLPYTNGFTSYNENIGSLQEKGFELRSTVFIIPNRSNRWGWSVTGSLVHTQDKITKLSKAMKDANSRLLENYSSAPNKIIQEGESQNMIYVVPSLGIDPSTGKEMFRNKDGQATYQWDFRDRIAGGLGQPKFRGNISSLVRYRDFSLSASFGYRIGGYLYNSTLIDKIENADKYFNVDSRVLTDRWVKPGDITKFRGLNDPSPTNASSRFLQKETTFTLQSISLSYDIRDRGWQRRAGIRNMNLSANTGELFYLSTVAQERGTAYPFSRQVSVNLAVFFGK